MNSNKENFVFRQSSVPRLVICKVTEYIDYSVQKVANSCANIDANLASHWLKTKAKTIAVQTVLKCTCPYKKLVS